MALTNCKECKKEISDQAAACPHCGFPLSKIPEVRDEHRIRAIVNEESTVPPKKSMGCFSIGCLSVVGIVFLLIIIGTFSSGGSSGTTSPSQTNISTAIVSNSAWDGSVRQVEKYLEDNLKDPDSYKAIEWSKVEEINANGAKFRVRCKYRAKNSFGGYVVDNKIFYMDAQGNVLFATDVN